MGAPSTVSTLQDWAEDLLTLAAAAVASTEAGPISRAFVSPALPALDCPEQLTVHVATLALENTQPSVPPPAAGHRAAQRYGSLNLPTFVVTVVRCIPVAAGNRNIIQPPPGDQITAAARRANEAGWAIWNYLITAVARGEIFGAPEKAVYVDALAPLQAQGGSAGYTLQVRAAMDGYQAP